MKVPPPSPATQAGQPENPTDEQPSQSAVENDLADELWDRTDHLETKLNVASENGLFIHQTKVAHKEILDRLTEAFRLSSKEEVTSDDYSKTIEALDTAQNLYDTAIQAAGLSRRLVYIYGLPSFAYLLLILLAVGWLVLFPPPAIAAAPAFLSIPKKILLAGTVGGILRGVKALWEQVDDMQYRKFWGTWFLICPIMGALLGGVVYLAFFVGIATSTLTTTISNPALALLGAILAGYNWEWARDLMEKAVDVLTGEATSK